MHNSFHSELKFWIGSPQTETNFTAFLLVRKITILSSQDLILKNGLAFTCLLRVILCNNNSRMKKKKFRKDKQTNLLGIPCLSFL